MYSLLPHAKSLSIVRPLWEVHPDHQIQQPFQPRTAHIYSWFLLSGTVPQVCIMCCFHGHQVQLQSRHLSWEAPSLHEYNLSMRQDVMQYCCHPIMPRLMHLSWEVAQLHQYGHPILQHGKECCFESLWLRKVRRSGGGGSAMPGWPLNATGCDGVLFSLLGNSINRNTAKIFPASMDLATVRRIM